MIEALLGIFSSGAFGAVTGLIGSWLTKREERENMRIEQEHILEMRKLDVEEAKVEHQQAIEIISKEIEVAQIEGEIAQDIEKSKAFTTSQKTGNKNTGVKIVDAIRGLMRPCITLYLLAMVSLLTYHISVISGGLSVFDNSQIIEMQRKIVAELLFLTTTAITWWFGARPSSKKK